MIIKYQLYCYIGLVKKSMHIIPVGVNQTLKNYSFKL